MNDNASRRVRDKNARNPTIIAYASVFQGHLRSSAPVIVTGIVEGNCAVENIVTIEESGTWIGNIHALCVIVNGKVKGDIVTDDKVEVGPTGQVHGNITAGSLAIASGAVIEGDMHMREHEEPIRFEEKRSVAAA
jgi:cytoskeletal protein CcmA (bactofilin family)